MYKIILYRFSYEAKFLYIEPSGSKGARCGIFHLCQGSRAFWILEHFGFPVQGSSPCTAEQLLLSSAPKLETSMGWSSRVATGRCMVSVAGATICKCKWPLSLAVGPMLACWRSGNVPRQSNHCGWRKMPNSLHGSSLTVTQYPRCASLLLESPT